MISVRSAENEMLIGIGEIGLWRIDSCSDAIEPDMKFIGNNILN